MFSLGRKKNNSFFKYDLHEWVTNSASLFFKSNFLESGTKEKTTFNSLNLQSMDFGRGVLNTPATTIKRAYSIRPYMMNLA